MTDDLKVLCLTCLDPDEGHQDFFNGEQILMISNFAPDCPWPLLDSERLAPTTGKLSPIVVKQGDAYLTHKRGWTALGVADYTGDGLLGSRTVFAVNKPDLTLQEVMVNVREFDLYRLVESRLTAASDIRVIKEINE